MNYSFVLGYVIYVIAFLAMFAAVFAIGAIRSHRKEEHDFASLCWFVVAVCVTLAITIYLKVF